jgi:hypothetical protein
MNIMDIKTALFTKLKTNFPNNQLYGEKVKQGFNRPAFFIEIIPVSNKLFNKHLTERVVSIDIIFIPDRDKNQEAEDILIMLDKLDSLFVSPLKIIDRYLTPQNNKNEIGESLLHYKFDLIFFEDSYYEETLEPTVNKVSINLTGE